MVVSDRARSAAPLAAGALALVVVVVLAATTYLRAEPGPTGPPPITATDPLDVVVFLVDDMDDISCADTAAYLPASSPWLRDQGRCFENATVSSPVCCPSRAAMHTGQLGHNNGVRTQHQAQRLRVRTSMMDILSRAGFTTYGTGKHFNGVHPRFYESGDLDSGFDASDFWNSREYYRYKLWSDEAQDVVPPADRVHPTVRAADFTARFLQEAVTRPESFYAFVGFKAPHLERVDGPPGSDFPVPTRANRHRPVPPLRWAPERDVTDKLPLYGELEGGRRYFERLHAARVRSLYDVDEQMARILRLLEDAGRLDETVVVFTSDNGYQLGTNGWHGKSSPYAGSLEVPLLVRYPAAFGAGVDTRPVGLVDLAPTIYDLVGIDAPHVLDGHSLLGDHVRTGTFHEFTNERSRLVAEESGELAIKMPSWASYREGDRAYVEYYGREGQVIAREFYDDPDQQVNLLARAHADRRPPRRLLDRFEDLLTAARECRGTVESGAPQPCP